MAVCQNFEAPSESVVKEKNGVSVAPAHHAGCGTVNSVTYCAGYRSRAAHAITLIHSRTSSDICRIHRFVG